MANEKRLIDANALAVKIYDLRFYVNGLRSGKTLLLEYMNKYRDEIFKAICKSPTVDAVEVIHAKWENVQKGKGCCSNCHRLDIVDSLATHCRYCGAKMDGGNEDG